MVLIVNSLELDKIIPKVSSIIREIRKAHHRDNKPSVVLIVCYSSDSPMHNNYYKIVNLNILHIGGGIF
jgi:hypothetical protein